MSVIQLEDCLLRQLCDVGRIFFIVCDRILDTGRDEKVLLPEAQFLSFIGAVIRIEDSGQLVRKSALFHDRIVVLVIRSDCPGIPEKHRIDDPVPMADDRNLIRNSQNLEAVPVNKVIPLFPVIVDLFHPAAKTNDPGFFRMTDLEGISLINPVIRELSLISVYDGLPEQTVVITNAAADRTVAEGGERFHKA